MITVVIKGGLGNQLFQYASAYALANRLKQDVVLDISFFPKQTLRGYKLGELRLEKHEISDGKNDDLLMSIYKNKNINGVIRRLPFKTFPMRNKGIYLIDHAGKFTPDFFSVEAENLFLNGYFQSEEYFLDVRDSIMKQFVPSYSAEKEFHDALEDVSQNDTVAVHIRHGDFVNNDGTDFHYVLNKEYYERAIAKIRSLVVSPRFYCFSDDIEWVKQNIGGSRDFHFISLTTSHADIDEMMLMKSCNHIITANSTFSWWAAWLNEHENSIRIVPDKAYGNSHMIPNAWLKIACD